MDLFGGDGIRKRYTGFCADLGRLADLARHGQTLMSFSASYIAFPCVSRIISQGGLGHTIHRSSAASISSTQVWAGFSSRGGSSYPTSKISDCFPNTSIHRVGRYQLCLPMQLNIMIEGDEPHPRGSRNVLLLKSELNSHHSSVYLWKSDRWQDLAADGARSVWFVIDHDVTIRFDITGLEIFMGCLQVL